MKLKTHQIFGIYAYLGIMLLVIVFSVALGQSTPPTEAKAVTVHTIPSDKISLEAKAAILYDINAGTIIYAKNEEAQLPIASLTKLMTALTAATSSENGSTLAISKAALGEEGDTGLRPSEHWRISDLISLTLVASSNDGAAAIADALGPREAFVARMNETAHALGLTQTYFLNPTGLDVNAELSGGYSSAHDVARLLNYLIANKPELIEKTKQETFTTTSLDGFTHTVTNTNKELAAGESIFASKTGFTDLAGGNLAVAFDVGPARPMIAVVLGSSEKGRFQDIDTLIHAGLSYVREEL